MKKILALILSLSLVLSLFTLAGCKGDEPNNESDQPNNESDNGEVTGDTIKVGLITPKTGDVAIYGVAVDNAINLAVNEINAKGGINGKLIEFISYDDKGDAAESMNLFNRLVEVDKIDALLGPVISGTTLAVAPLAEEAGMPMVTPTATSAEVTVGKEFVFRACFIDPYQGGAVARYAVDTLGAKTAAILYNNGDDYSTGLAETYKEAFEEAGGTVNHFYGYTKEDKDFKSVLTTIKADEPDVLYLPDYYNAVGLIAEQIKEVGLNAQLLGVDGWDGVLKNYAAVVEGGIFSNHFAADDPSPIVQDFISAYKEAYGEVPNALAALGYDGAKILFDAIERAGSTDKVAIKDALKATNLESVTGHLTFDENNNPIKEAFMIKIENGENKFEAKAK